MLFNFSKFLISPYSKYLSAKEVDDLKYLVKIFPFKVSEYVLKELIDWEKRDNDPIYRLTFPRHEMLSEEHWHALRSAKSKEEERLTIRQIRHYLNPNPDGQKYNIPTINGRELGGMQHKYKETVLFFPAPGQTCHSYCTYCFRWAQFVNLDDEHKFKSKYHKDLYDYLSVHPEVTDILITGGDPMYMNNEKLFLYLDVIMSPELNHIQNIRIGTKALSYHPARFLGSQGEELLARFEEIIKKGKNIALMLHLSHYNELRTKTVQQAIKRIRESGVIMRTQAPLIRGINNTSEVWKTMWLESVRMGIIPYYMFIERDTGAHDYFAVPLVRALEIYMEAQSQLTGLAKTARGPVMSTSPGKVLVDGVAEIGGEKKFILKFIQCRNPRLNNIPFFAEYDEQATWLDELRLDAGNNQELANLLNKYVKQRYEHVA